MMVIFFHYEISVMVGFIRLRDFNDGQFCSLQDFNDSWLRFSVSSILFSCDISMMVGFVPLKTKIILNFCSKISKKH